jgi:hypothetical protein
MVTTFAFLFPMLFNPLNPALGIIYNHNDTLVRRVPRT